jgi:hypothetical protein
MKRMTINIKKREEGHIQGVVKATKGVGSTGIPLSALLP